MSERDTAASITTYIIATQHKQLRLSIKNYTVAKLRGIILLPIKETGPQHSLHSSEEITQNYKKYKNTTVQSYITLPAKFRVVFTLQLSCLQQRT